MKALPLLFFVAACGGSVRASDLESADASSARDVAALPTNDDAAPPCVVRLGCVDAEAVADAGAGDASPLDGRDDGADACAGYLESCGACCAPFECFDGTCRAVFMPDDAGDAE